MSYISSRRGGLAPGCGGWGGGGAAGAEAQGWGRCSRWRKGCLAALEGLATGKQCFGGRERARAAAQTPRKVKGARARQKAATGRMQAARPGPAPPSTFLPPSARGPPGWRPPTPSAAATAASSTSGMRRDLRMWAASIRPGRGARGSGGGSCEGRQFRRRAASGLSRDGRVWGFPTLAGRGSADCRTSAAEPRVTKRGSRRGRPTPHQQRQPPAAGPALSPRALPAKGLKLL
jgi:hypothetical protein